MGSRLLRDRVTRPLLSIEPLNERLDQVEGFFNDGLFRAELRGVLKGMPDLERLTNKVVSGRATPRDVAQIRAALDVMPDLEHVASNLFVSNDASATKAFNSVSGLIDSLDWCDEVSDLIGRAIVEDAPSNTAKSGFVARGFSAELDGVVSASAHARDWVADLEPREKERTGITALKVGFNKVFGYYIEITRANSHLAPEDYIRLSLIHI